MNLIKLTSEYGETLVINADYIIFIQNYSSRKDHPRLTEISLMGGHRITCRETQEDITNSAKGALCVPGSSHPICNKKHIDDVKKPDIYTDL